MRTALCLLCWLLAIRLCAAEAPSSAPADSFADDSPHTIIFQDGHTFRGRLLSIGSKELIFRRPDMATPLCFLSGEVRRILADPLLSPLPRRGGRLIIGVRPNLDAPPTPLFATVQLSGSDWLFGELRSADGQTFSLKLAEGVAFTIPRGSVRWFHIDSARASPFGFFPKDVPDLKADRLSAINQNAVEGALESISDKSVLFSGAAKPLAAGLFLQLPTQPPDFPDSTCQLHFGDQGELRAADLRFEKGRVHLRTAFAADVELPLESFTEITFKENAPSHTEPLSRLFFAGGEYVEGTLLAAKESHVQWSMASGQAIALSWKQVSGIRFPVGQREPPETGATLVTLRNGDRLRGQFAGLDTKALILADPLLGQKSLALASIHKVWFDANRGFSDGARDPEAWMHAGQQVGVRVSKASDPGPWTYLDGAYLPGGISNFERPQIALPSILQAPLRDSLERFEISFEATQPEGGRQPAFSFTVGNPLIRGPFVSFSFHNGVLQSSTSVTFLNFRTMEVKDAPAQSHLDVRLFVDAKSGAATLYIDGLPAAQMNHTKNQSLIGLDETVRFQSENINGTPMIFSNLWIGAWNGELPPQARPADGEKQPSALPRISLRNGDLASGALRQIRNGEAVIDTELGPLQIPAEEVASIDFGGDLKPQGAAARLRFPDGACLLLDSFRLEGGELTAHSLTLGDLRLPVAAISELILHPAPSETPFTQDH